MNTATSAAARTIPESTNLSSAPLATLPSAALAASMAQGGASDQGSAARRALSYSDDEKRIIIDSFMPGATESEARALIKISEVLNLNVFKRQIHFVKRRAKNEATGQYEDRWAFQTSIDGYRSRAESSGEWEGTDEAVFTFEEGVNPRDGQPTGKKELVARVIVHRRGRRPCVGVTRYSEFVQTKNDGTPISQWAQKPRHMLAKCAEALAYRIAFPELLGGTYTEDEMPPAEAPIVAGELAPVSTQLRNPDPELAPRETDDQAIARLTAQIEAANDDASMVAVRKELEKFPQGHKVRVEAGQRWNAKRKQLKEGGGAAAPAGAAGTEEKSTAPAIDWGARFAAMTVETIESTFNALNEAYQGNVPADLIQSFDERSKALEAAAGA